VCAQDNYAASEGLDDLVIRIGQMIAYQFYNTKSPLNGLAAKWASENIEKLPVDAREISPPQEKHETSPTSIPYQVVNITTNKLDNQATDQNGRNNNYTQYKNSACPICHNKVTAADVFCDQCGNKHLPIESKEKNDSVIHNPSTGHYNNKNTSRSHNNSKPAKPRNFENTKKSQYQSKQINKATKSFKKPYDYPTTDRSYSKLYLILGSIAVILLIIIIIISYDANHISKSELLEMGKNREVEQLLYFINKNHQMTYQMSKVQIAIIQIIDNNLNTGKKILEKWVLSEKLSERTMSFVVSRYTENNTSFASCEETIGLYIRTVNSTLKNNILRMLPFFPRNELNKAIQRSLLKLVKEEDLSSITKLLSIEYLNSINQSQTFHKIKSLIVKIEKKQKNINDKKDSIDSINSELKKMNREIQEAQEYIKENKFFYLKAFIIANSGTYNGFDMYEISLPEYNYYYGNVPSQNHAVLITTETTFKSKGRFELAVQKTGKLPIKLKQQFGGFNQDWPLYIEVNSQTRKNVVAEKKTLKIKQKTVKSKNTHKRKVEKQLIRNQNQLKIIKNDLKSLF